MNTYRVTIRETIVNEIVFSVNAPDAEAAKRKLQAAYFSADAGIIEVARTQKEIDHQATTIKEHKQ